MLPKLILEPKRTRSISLPMPSVPFEQFLLENQMIVEYQLSIDQLHYHVPLGKQEHLYLKEDMLPYQLQKLYH